MISQQVCSICDEPWGVGEDEDYRDPRTNELVCNSCALDGEGTDYYEQGCNSDYGVI
jgi:hypothetical protein